jgi:serine/threonine protein kinase
VTLTAGTRLGPYEIVEPLGSGGMGEVYRARDPRLGREVAIKLVATDGEPSPDRLRRFETEARAAAALSHPNVITVEIRHTSSAVTPFPPGELPTARRQRYFPRAAAARASSVSYRARVVTGRARLVTLRCMTRAPGSAS